MKNYNSNEVYKQFNDDPTEVLEDIKNDDVFAKLAQLANDDKLNSDDRQKILIDMADEIGSVDQSMQGLLRDAIMKAVPEYKKTATDNFIKTCVSKFKKKRKNERSLNKIELKAKQKAQSVATRGENTIIVDNRQLRDVLNDIRNTLVNAVNANPTEPPVYVKVGALSRVVCDEKGMYSSQEIKPAAMQGILTNIATWKTIIETDRMYKELDVFPPKGLADIVLNMGEWPGIPALAAIANAPVFSKHGVLHSEKGYSANSGFYYTGGVVLGDTNPTPERVEWAKNMLLVELMSDFPFKDQSSKAHALAYGINPFVREMIDGPVPPTVFDAPTEGTGKGKLMNALACIFLGHDAPTTADTEDDDEWRKRITTKLLSGATHLAIDNVSRELDSGVLANAWTQPIWDDRTLGANRDVKIPNRMIWSISANNIQLSRENTRRVIWCRLDANMERPSQRDTESFRHPALDSWVKENRNDLITAVIVLTLVSPK